MNLQTAISKFSHAFVNSSGESLNESSIKDDSFYNQNQNEDNVLFEGYLVYSTKRKNPTGRGKVGWSLGVKTSNMANHLKDVTVIGSDGEVFTLSEDKKYDFPIRVYGLFHYDLQKNIKFVASMAYDNSYRELEFDKSTGDFIGDVGDAFTFDSFRGEAAEFSFDFGFMYAVNDNFRIGVHFQQPYIDFHWEFFEF